MHLLQSRQHELKALKCHAQIYLQQLDDIHSASGLPAGVVRVLNSKACRGAIMFGDKLELHEVKITHAKLPNICYRCDSLHKP